MDALSDVLMSLNTRSVHSARLKTGGSWSIWYPQIKEIKFATVTEGSCYITLDGEEPMRLNTGDCYLLTDGRPHQLSSAPDLSPVDAHVAYAGAVDGLAHYRNRDGFMAYAGKFDLGRLSSPLIFRGLPSLIQIDGASKPAGTISWMLKELAAEVTAPLAGSALMIDHVARIMLLQAIRVYAESADRGASGWLAALSDERLSIAIGLMHARPGHKWSVPELAAAAGMSKSLFSLRFKERVGMPPLDYLIQWRISIAARELMLGRKPISTISFSLGYESESAFSSSFKRVTGLAPRHYRESHRGDKANTFKVLADRKATG